MDAPYGQRDWMGSGKLLGIKQRGCAKPLNKREKVKIMNLYDRLLTLQEIPNAYTSWEPYRQSLTDYIIGQLNKSEDVLILGIGRGNDMDLKQLIPHIKSLTLWDKEEQAIHEALVQYGLETHTQVKCIGKDILGLSPKDYRQYADELMQFVMLKGMQTDVEALKDVGLKALQKLTEKIKVTPIGEKAYDTIIMIGLHSQLLSMMHWIWQVILQILQKEEMTVSTSIMALNNQIIPQIHQVLIQAARRQLITGCELERLGRIGTVQGALQGLQDLQRLRRVGCLEKKSELQLIWPFHTTQNVSYKMKIQCDEVI